MHFYQYLLNFFIVFVLSSCSELTPLYVKNDETQKMISNIDIMPIPGRYGVYLKNELIETFGTNLSKNEGDYFVLQAEINVGTGGAESFNSDGTASRAAADVTISYTLYNERGCAVFGKSNSTKATYNSKSGGYDFGNIASQRAAINRNIEFNVKSMYPHIYKGIKNKPEPIPFRPPYIGIANFRGC